MEAQRQVWTIHKKTLDPKIRHIIEDLRARYGAPSPGPRSDPLDVLIETILSQSTTDINSRRAFESLKRRFPTWEQARRARAASIEAAIRSGGLARQKSKRIKAILNEIYERRGSLDLSFLCSAPIQEAVEFLSSLKGIGPKTIACTLLFACHRPLFPVDTHIFRIGQRLGLLPKKCSFEEAHRRMADLFPAERYYEIHINLIRHGRKICRAQNPLCEKCCLIEYCQFYEQQAG
jgi:endonuclease-3